MANHSNAKIIFATLPLICESGSEGAYVEILIQHGLNCHAGKLWFEMADKNEPLVWST